MQGIDVSYHNGNIDWNKVKSDGVDFAIIRAGYGKVISQKDKKFEENYAGAKKAGIPVGAYWYSYATTVAEAQQEARVFLEAIKGKQFEMPVYFDIEEKNQMSNASALIQAFCSVVEAAGYFVGFYMSESYTRSYVSLETRQRYSHWNARWGSSQDLGAPMWQYTDSGSVAGISGHVDMNRCYSNFEAIIKANGLNGFEATGATVPETSQEHAETCDHVVAGVFDGVTIYKKGD